MKTFNKFLNEVSSEKESIDYIEEAFDKIWTVEYEMNGGEYVGEAHIKSRVKPKRKGKKVLIEVGTSSLDWIEIDFDGEKINWIK